jgi:hypothetical protein
MRILTTIALLAGLTAAAPANAAPNPACGDAVFRDWSDGQIAGRYALPCYGEALDGLPEDVRAYSTAEEDISQALRARIRETRRDVATQEAETMSFIPSVPVPIGLLSAGVIALLLGLAGLVRLVARRLRQERVTHRPTRPIGQW